MSAVTPHPDRVHEYLVAANVERLMIHCDDATIQAAFAQHLERYGARQRAWDTPYHISMWQRAQKAFDLRSQADFDYIYEELRRRWQVFRGSRQHWTSEQAFNALLAGCPELQRRRLAELSPSDVPRLWDMLQSVRNLKQTGNGPSTVAVSKFLHFWNPRLFIIVDDGVIWKWVLAHHWVWEPIQRMREVTDISIFGGCQKHDDVTCDLGTYLAIVAWAGTFVRDHPQLPVCFADYIQRHAGDAQLPTAIAEYEAVAMEWFLLGVVEIPPAGWTTKSGTNTV
jgi:hypothetical protein